MKNMQKGFTLIELMIVIAIPGILLAIAIPAYQDYTVRARVTEGINLAAPAKLAVSETRISNGDWPSDNAAAGYETANSTYVTSVVIDAGVITVTYSASTALDDAASETILFTPSFNGTAVEWSCNDNKSFGTNGSVPTRFVPASCRVQ